MILVDRGELRLDDRAVLFLPEFGKNGKENVTIRQLLMHTSGLPDWEPSYTYCGSYEEVIGAVCNAH